MTEVTRVGCVSQYILDLIGKIRNRHENAARKDRENKLQEGDYAYRFSGHSIDNGYDHYLVGVGTMTLGAGGTISGHQRTALTRLRGDDSVLITGLWSIDGSFALHEKAYGKHDHAATMTFTQQNPENAARRQILEGTFSFVPVSDKKIWIIATGGMLLSSNGEPINEAVNGEAELIS